MRPPRLGSIADGSAAAAKGRSSRIASKKRAKRAGDIGAVAADWPARRASSRRPQTFPTAPAAFHGGARLGASVVEGRGGLVGAPLRRGFFRPGALGGDGP